MSALLLQLLFLMLLFTLIEYRWPAAPTHRWWRRPILVDLCAWAVHPLAISAGITAAVIVADYVVMLFSGSGVWRFVEIFRIWVVALPYAAQFAATLIIMDFLSYWIHRAYHRFPALWAFHVVHHSSEEIDWLSTSRLHPISQIIDTALMGIVLLLIGFPLSAVIASNIFIGGAALLVHANVRLNLGPLARLFVSPLFHQWHHAYSNRDNAGYVFGNYGALLSVWDRLFGTVIEHTSCPPERFGVEGSPPQTLIGLGLHPLRCLYRTLLKRN